MQYEVINGRLTKRDPDVANLCVLSTSHHLKAVSPCGNIPVGNRATSGYSRRDYVCWRQSSRGCRGGQELWCEGRLENAMKLKRGIFFDLDGTLVDNEHLKARAFSEAIEKLGGKSHPSNYKEVMGMSGSVIRQHFLDRAGIQIDLEAYIQACQSIYARLLKSDLTIKPGAIQLLSEAKRRGLHLALVSGASSVSVTHIVNALNLGRFFDFVIASEDVINKKPNPECYRLAMDKMLVASERVVVFEDTEAGLKAANSAGTTSLCIRHSYNQSHDLSKAVAEYYSFETDFASICKRINSIFNDEIF